MMVVPCFPSITILKKKCIIFQGFEVLPGYGFDNLRNIEQNQVYAFSYEQCKTTEDGRYLLPDGVSSIPIKSSKVQMVAELIDHFSVSVSQNVFFFYL